MSLDQQLAAFRTDWSNVNRKLSFAQRDGRKSKTAELSLRKTIIENMIEKINLDINKCIASSDHSKAFCNNCGMQVER